MKQTIETPNGHGGGSIVIYDDGAFPDRVGDLKRDVYAGGGGGGGGGGAFARARVSDAGMIERTHEIQRLTEKIARLTAEIEMELSARAGERCSIGCGGGGAG